MGLDGTARARTRNRKSQHRVPDLARKPPKSKCLAPSPILLDLPQEATAGLERAVCLPDRPPKGPARGISPKWQPSPTLTQRPLPFWPLTLSPPQCWVWSCWELEPSSHYPNPPPHPTMGAPTSSLCSSLLSSLVQFSSAHQPHSSARLGLKDEKWVAGRTDSLS
jgi:hypothetical protein